MHDLGSTSFSEDEVYNADDVNSDDHRLNLVPTHTILKKMLHVVEGHKKKNNSLSVLCISFFL